MFRGEQQIFWVEFVKEGKSAAERRGFVGSVKV